MLTRHNCAEEFNAFSKFEISIRDDERVLICHESVHWSRIVEGSNAIRARPRWTRVPSKLSWPVDYPTTIREKFFRSSALSLFLFRLRDIAELGTSSTAVFVASSSRSRPGTDFPVDDSPPASDSITAFHSSSKNRWCTYGPLFRPQPHPCDWRARRERAQRRSRLNEWASEVYLDPVSRERDRTIAFYSGEQNIARMKLLVGIFILNCLIALRRCDDLVCNQATIKSSR